MLAAAYVTVCAGSYLMVRSAGAISLGQGALLGIGAYAIAIGSAEFGLPYWVSLVSAVGLSSLAGLVLAHLSIRLQGDYLVISTLSFQLVLYEIALNFTGLTNGPMGIVGVPRPELLGMSFESESWLLGFALVVAIAALAVASTVQRSPFGSVLVAVREQPTIATATGYSVRSIKAQVCALGGVFAGMGGAVIAGATRFVDPSVMALGESLLILSIIVLAGNRVIIGTLFGVAIVVIAPELLRFVGFSAPAVGYARGITYGLLLTLAARGSLFSARFTGWH
nr:branched-chain amino acid ABC transporter permease [Candidatus Thiosymbion oneisti]